MDGWTEDVWARGRHTLTRSEQRLARFMGISVHKQSVSAGVKDQQLGNDDPVDINIDGFGAELAFGYLRNCYPDLTLSPRSGGPDCVFGGWRIDVKFTKLSSGGLLAVRKPHPRIDLFYLITGKFPDYRLVGYIRAADLLCERFEDDLGHGPNYHAPQVNLERHPAWPEGD